MSFLFQDCKLHCPSSQSCVWRDFISILFCTLHY